MTTKSATRCLETSRGILKFPCFFPVTTFGGKYPLDDLVRPYLARLSQGVMVSHFYAQEMKKSQRPNLPLFIDSGGFASFFEGSRIDDYGEVAVIRTKDGAEIDPAAVLAFQEGHADIGATLDFLIPPNLNLTEAQRRQELTIKNAIWALKHRANRKMRLFASLQAWDRESALRITKALAAHNFDGFALGGMVPRVQQPRVIFEIVNAIREVDDLRPLHVFGIGSPGLLRSLLNRGVDSADSSSFLQNAAKKRYLHPAKNEFVSLDEIASLGDTCVCRICKTFDLNYLRLEGELNNLALALHNLTSLYSCCGI